MDLIKKYTKEQQMPGHEYEFDYEGDMAKTQLNMMMDAASELKAMLENDTNLPEWVQSKITKAADYIDSARDYMKNMNKDTNGNMHNEPMGEQTSAYGRIDARFKKLSGRSMGAAAKEYGDEAKRLQKELDAHNAEMERRKAAMKSEAVKSDDVPFKADEPRQVAKAGKFGAGYSTARHLARQAMQSVMKDLKKGPEKGKRQVS